MPSFDLNSDDEASGSGAPPPGSGSGVPPPSLGSPETTLAAGLHWQVNVSSPEKAVNYARLFLPVDFGPPHMLQPSPFSPPPPDSRDIAMLFDTDEAGEFHLDCTRMVEMFYPLVHPDCDEYSVNHETGLRTRHSFVNIAILTDVFLEDDTARRLLDLV